MDVAARETRMAALAVLEHAPALLRGVADAIRARGSRGAERPSRGARARLPRHDRETIR